jgi:hypothetical protein
MNSISMHPLVHAWARDRLIEAEQREYWIMTASTLAVSISWEFQSSDYHFRRFLLPHIDSCLHFHKDELFIRGDAELERLDMVSKFALAYREGGQLQETMELNEKVLEARVRQHT